VAFVAGDAKLPLDQIGHARAGPQGSLISQRLWSLREQLGEPLTVISREERLAAGAASFPQAVFAAGPIALHSACHGLSCDMHTARHFRLVPPLLPQADCGEAASFRSIEIASNSGGITYTRLDTVWREKCR
jgi:hypothetical protein